MNKLDFYKEMYFKEHDLKHKLDDKVTMQIGILTLIVSINTYILKGTLDGNLLVIVKYNMLFVGGGIVLALWFLGQSFMNLGRTHSYRELASMNDFRVYDMQLKQANRGAEYEEYLEKESADCATMNRKINIWRTEKLASCKVSLFVSFIVTFINSLLYIIGIFIVAK
jgi:hypothetical protein